VTNPREDHKLGSFHRAQVALSSNGKSQRHRVPGFDLFFVELSLETVLAHSTREIPRPALSGKPLNFE